MSAGDQGRFQSMAFSEHKPGVPWENFSSPHSCDLGDLFTFLIVSPGEKIEDKE